MVTLLKELIQKSLKAYKRQRVWKSMGGRNKGEKGLTRGIFRPNKRRMRTKEGALK